MRLGQFSLFISLLLVASALSWNSFAKEKQAPLKKPSPEDLEKIGLQVSMTNWDEVLKITEDFSSDPLIQILRQKARYEKKAWDDIIKAEANTDFRFKDYDSYIRYLALFESQNFTQLQGQEIPKEVPKNFREYMSLLRAKSYLEEKKLTDAKKYYREFIDEFPNSRFRSEAMLELANVEWELENKFEALHLYEKIYIYYPLNDSENLAPQRLKEMGRFESLDPGVHLKRIQTLKRSALFSKAIRELQQLEKISEDTNKERVRLALAGLEFARKSYSQSESLSKNGIRRTKDSQPDLMEEWKSLLAFSLVRQGKYDKAREIYNEILSLDIASAEREQILLRLGLMALDDKDFKEAEKYFSQLRTEFKHGSYQESSHWFEAWSIFQQASDNKDEKLSKELKTKLNSAVELLSKIPNLPEGKALTGQALYWQSRVLQLLNEKKKAAARIKDLETKWSASFYSLLGDPGKLQFLNYQENLAAPELIVREKKKFLVSDPAFQQLAWKRLEAFVSVRLHTWAQLELENFMKVSGQKNEGLRKAVAYRLQVLEDWSDLVKFSQRNFPLDLNEIRHDEELSHFHYPQAYGEDVLKAANEFQVSPFLIWGVMREESRFQADVVSFAGAVGLLQLMPNLGNQIGVRLREGRVNRAKLSDPSVNIRYATFHLRELIEQIQGWKVSPEFIFPLVVASYNAGSAPVKRWLQEMEGVPVDVFVESIPYSETRNYVKRVIQSANIYWRLYGEKNDRIAKTKGENEL